MFALYISTLPLNRDENRDVTAGHQTACLDGDERLPDCPTYQDDEAECDNHTSRHNMSED